MTLITRLLLFVTAVSTALSFRIKAEDLPQPTFQKTSCRLLINEINLYSESPDDEQYIELSRYCQDKFLGQKKISMTGFKLLFISQDGYLEGLCDLDGDLEKRALIKSISIGEQIYKEKRNYWLYLIGGGRDDVQFNRSDCQLQLYSDQDIYRFPTGPTFPIMIAVVYNERSDMLSSIHMKINNGKYERQKLTVPMEFLVMKYLQDAYIFGPKTYFQYCTYFDKYFKFQNDDYVLLRDWNGLGGDDFSLSRCSKSDREKQIIPLQSHLWRYTRPTPGQVNSCNDGINFRIEYIQQPATITANASTSNCIAETSDPAIAYGYVAFPNEFQRELENEGGSFWQQNTSVSEVESASSSCSGQSNSTASVIADDNLEEEDIYAEDLEEPAGNVVSLNANKLDRDEFENNLRENSPYIWTNCTRFVEADRNIIQNLPGQPIRLQDILKPSVCNWFRYDQTKGLYTCHLCKSLVDQGIIYDKPSSKQITSIMREGIMSVHGEKRKYQNKWYINNHVKSIFHRMTTRWFRIYDAGARSLELERLFENSVEYKEYIQSTNNLISAAIYSVKLGLPYRKFQMLLELLNSLDVDIGFKHQNFNGIKVITEIVSDTLHSDMFKYLKDNTPALTVPLDGTTDISTTPVLAILFQYDHRVDGIQIRLYKIIKLNEGESGQAIFKAFKSALQEDGLEEYVRENVQSVTSDGAPNIYSKFNELLESFSEKPILRVWCQNHLYDLIYKNFVKKYEDLISVSNIVNKCHCIFSKSPKAKSLLDSVAVEKGTQPFSVKRTHCIRWVSSNLRSYEIVFTNWEIIVIALERIINNKTYKQAMRENANFVLGSLKTPSFLTSLAFILEISRVMSKITLSLETRGNTLISKTSLRTDFKNEIEALEEKELNTVQVLLKDSKLVHPNIKGDDRVKLLSEFETKQVIFRSKVLSPLKILEGKRLFELQPVYAKDIIRLVDHYYPSGIHESYEIFNPFNFPVTQQRVGTFGNYDIKKLNAQLKWGFNENELLKSWKVLIAKVIQHKDFASTKCLAPELFWTHFLKKKNFAGFNNVTISVIKKALTVSSSNAESERFLSLYSGVKTYQRYSLAPETVESILRVKTNLNRKISVMELNRFSKHFIIRGHSRADEIGARKMAINRKDWDIVIQEESLNSNILRDCDDECLE